MYSEIAERKRLSFQKNCASAIQYRDSTIKGVFMKRDFSTVKRIVIKVGTSSLIQPDKTINLERIDQLAFVISSLSNKGLDVILVSSGAMGFGFNVLGLPERPAEIARHQAVSSVGQVAMMSLYAQIFGHYQSKVSQILLTRDVVEFPESLHNVSNAFENLLAMKIIPVVAGIVHADLLLMLSDVDGLFDKNPAEHADAKLRSRVTQIDDTTIRAAGGSGSRFGTGGMASKIKSAQIVFDNAGQMVLMNSRHPRDILRVLAGEEIGTWFAKEK